MRAIHTLSEYRSSIDQIKVLKHRMWMLASQKGNLHPDVIRISQEIDEYIVLVQRYWQKNQHADSLIG